MANGRLAMMAIIGMFFQDGLTGSAWGGGPRLCGHRQTHTEYVWPLAAGRRPCAGRLFASPQRTCCTNAVRARPKRDTEEQPHKVLKFSAHNAAQGNGVAIGRALGPRASRHMDML